MPKTSTARVLTIAPKASSHRRSTKNASGSDAGFRADVHARREVDVQTLGVKCGVELVQHHSQATLYIDIDQIVQGGSLEVESIEAVEQLGRAMLEAARQWRARGFTEPWPA